MESAYLFIDTSVRGRIRLAAIPVNPRHPVEERVSELPRNLFAFVERFFGLRLRCARGIIVVAGPGSFSSIRSGVLLANLMSRLLRLPLYRVLKSMDRGIGGAEGVELGEIRTSLMRGDLAPVPYVAPVYDAEPNITLHPDVRRGVRRDRVMTS